ncbi:hypothetical protein VTI28DRAFT_1192 [Corynascus sepedonium]
MMVSERGSRRSPCRTCTSTMPKPLFSTAILPPRHLMANSLFCLTTPTRSRRSRSSKSPSLKICSCLAIRPDRVTYISDHFQLLYEICRCMVAVGNAYADNTNPEVRPRIDTIACLASEGTDRRRKPWPYSRR